MPARKRTGRPLKDHAPDDLANITVQVKGELKAKLQERAIAGHRSLSQEVTMILSDALAGPSGHNLREFGAIAGTWATRIGLLLQVLERLADHPGGGLRVHPDHVVRAEMYALKKTLEALKAGDRAEALRITLFTGAEASNE